MGTLVKRGKAQIAGFAGAFDVIIYPVIQSGKASHNWDEEVTKDNIGFDSAWLARNEHILADFNMKLLGDTQAHAIAGGALLAPLATVVLSGSELAAYNGTYQYIGGAEIDLGNTKVGDFNIKLRRYADETQNDLANKVPL